MPLPTLLTRRPKADDQQSLTEQSVLEFKSIETGSAVPVLRRVKLLGMKSKNGRRYLDSALSEAVGLYNGSKVNVNHPSGDPLAPRDIRDRIGILSNVEYVKDDGLYGDLEYNPKHAIAESVAWAAEHKPELLGLSHNVLARTKRSKGETIVESITRVVGVDLVADPATNKNLFEHSETNGEEEPTTETVQAIAESVPEDESEWRSVVENIAADPALSGLAVPMADDGEASAMQRAGSALIEAMIAVIRDSAIDSGEKLKKLRLLLRTGDKLSDEEPAGEQVETTATENSDDAARDASIKMLVDHVQKTDARLVELERAAELREGLERFGLTPAGLNAAQREQLAAASDADAVAAIVESWPPAQRNLPAPKVSPANRRSETPRLTLRDSAGIVANPIA